MKSYAQTASPTVNIQSETSASKHHLSDTLDWSSITVQLKNRIVIVPVYAEVQTITGPAKDYAISKKHSSSG